MKKIEILPHESIVKNVEIVYGGKTFKPLNSEGNNDILYQYFIRYKLIKPYIQKLEINGLKYGCIPLSNGDSQYIYQILLTFYSPETNIAFNVDVYTDEEHFDYHFNVNGIDGRFKRFFNDYLKKGSVYISEKKEFPRKLIESFKIYKELIVFNEKFIEDYERLSMLENKFKEKHQDEIINSFQNTGVDFEYKSHYYSEYRLKDNSKITFMYIFNVDKYDMPKTPPEEFLILKIKKEVYINPKDFVI